MLAESRCWNMKELNKIGPGIYCEADTGLPKVNFTAGLNLVWPHE
jgi:hypothetical protein